MTGGVKWISISVGQVRAERPDRPHSILLTLARLCLRSRRKGLTCRQSSSPAAVMPKSLGAAQCLLPYSARV
jgi:hypothetical protein